jgi:hypothetical protein
MALYKVEVDTGYAPGGSFAILEWSPEPPTVEGWYWVRVPDPRVDHPPFSVMCLYLRVKLNYKNFQGVPTGKNSLWFDVPVASYDCEIPAPQDATHWLGPLPIPELPKGVNT